MSDQPRDAQCIFCRIVAGEVPSHKLYEDERVYAFLDIGPLSEGHVLVIPKAHYVTLDEAPDEVGAAIGAVLPKLSAAVMAAVDAEAWNVLQNNGRAANQAVDHVHFHIIPKYASGEGLPFDWPAGKLDDETAERLKERITRRLNG